MSEYIVTVKKDSNWEDLKADLTTDTSSDDSVNSSIIPDREVSVTDERPGNRRNTEYDLSDDEADTLRNDPRIASVTKKSTIEPPRPNIIQEGQDSGSFNKTTSSSGNQDNWGLLRHISTTNNWGGTGTSDPGGAYNYVLDGTGVDVVIMDTGIEANHPEWQDADGNTRLQQIDWSSTYTGTSYTQHSNIYTDTHGHGTHVASTVAGKTFGWAKNARIYVLANVSPGVWKTGGTPNEFDVVKDWHNAKSGADAGRPTVVNMSFGYAWFLKTTPNPNMTSSDGSDDAGAVTGGRYRGTTNTNVSSLLGNSTGLTGEHQGSGIYGYPRKYASIDADIEEMTNAGIHVVIGAGNDSMKMDKSGGADFNNYLTFSNPSFSHIYYHRGGSPSNYECDNSVTNGLNDSPTIDENDAIIVGSIKNQAYSSTLEQKVNFSQSGPQVDLYAAGSQISGACSNTSDSAMGAQTYSLNSSYKQAKISGTSMASPQVAGMVACFLQAHPDWTPKQVKNWFIENATDKLHSTSSNNDYTTNNSIHGGNQRVAYFPTNGSKPFTYSSS